MEFKLKENIHAIQYTGDNAYTVLAFLKENGYKDSRYHVKDRKIFLNKKEVVPMSYFFVFKHIDNNGVEECCFSYLEKEFFEHKYEPVDKKDRERYDDDPLI